MGLAIPSPDPARISRASNRSFGLTGIPNSGRPTSESQNPADSRKSNMKRPQFTLRVSMIAIAIAALGPWGYTPWRRSIALAAKAQECETKAEKGLLRPNWGFLNAKQWAFIAGTYQFDDAERVEHRHKITRYLYIIKLIELHHEWERRWKEHYRDLSLKYRRAARFPWLPVDPDPPEPRPIDPDPPPPRPRRRPKIYHPTRPDGPIPTARPDE